MQPKSVKREGRSIHIVWGDNHKSIYEIPYLRHHCPCAMCRGHRPFDYGKKVDLPSFQEGQPLDLKRSEPVGRYAIQFAFNDGHDTGIYSFDHLRKICPCPECAPAQVNIPSP